MTKTKPKTQEQLDREADQRLRRTYGISLAEYDVLFSFGGWGCWICSKTIGTKRLHVDHDHAYKKIKVFSDKSWTIPPWVSSADYLGQQFIGFGQTKSESQKKVREKLKRASVRGLLCSWCNRGLRFYHDNPNVLRSASEYLTNSQFGKTVKFLEAQ